MSEEIELQERKSKDDASQLTSKMLLPDNYDGDYDELRKVEQFGKVVGYFPFNFTCISQNKNFLLTWVWAGIILIVLLSRLARNTAAIISEDAIERRVLLGIFVYLFLTVIAIWMIIQYKLHNNEDAGRVLVFERQLGLITHCDNKEEYLKYLEGHDSFMSRVTKNHFYVLFFAMFFVTGLLNIKRIQFYLDSGGAEDMEIGSFEEVDRELFVEFGDLYLLYLLITDLFYVVSIGTAWCLCSMFFHIFRRHLLAFVALINDESTPTYRLFLGSDEEVLTTYRQAKALSLEIKVDHDAFPWVTASTTAEENGDGITQSSSSVAVAATSKTSAEGSLEEALEFRNNFLDYFEGLEHWTRRESIQFIIVLGCAGMAWMSGAVIVWAIDGGEKQSGLVSGIVASVCLMFLAILAANMMKIYRLQKHVRDLVEAQSGQRDDKSTEDVIVAGTGGDAAVDQGTGDKVEDQAPFRRVETTDLDISDHVWTLSKLYGGVLVNVVALLVVLLVVAAIWVLWRIPSCVEFKSANYNVEEVDDRCSDRIQTIRFVLNGLLFTVRCRVLLSFCSFLAWIVLFSFSFLRS